MGYICKLRLPQFFITVKGKSESVRISERQGSFVSWFYPELILLASSLHLSARHIRTWVLTHSMLAVSYWHVCLLRRNWAPRLLLHRSPTCFFSLLCNYYCLFPQNLSNNHNKNVIQPLTESQKKAFPIQLGLVLWLVKAQRILPVILSYYKLLCVFDMGCIFECLLYARCYARCHKNYRLVLSL